MDTIRQTIYDIDLSKQLQRIFSGVMLAANDKLANRMGANVFQDGQEVSLAGYTVKGYFIRNGLDTLILEGAVDGNTAYIDLDARCYHRDGSYILSVVLCKDGNEQTLVIYDGRIAETVTDTIVENENTLSLADLVQLDWVQNVLDAADTATAQAGKAEEAAAQAQAIKDSMPPEYGAAVAEMHQKAPAIPVDASGDIVHITDGAAMPVQSLITHIEPVQEGEGNPSPVNKRPIRGWDSVVTALYQKNLLKVDDTLNGLTVSGVTFSVDEQGRVHCAGTANAQIVQRVGATHLRPNSSFVYSGAPNNATGETYTANIKVGGSYIGDEAGNGRILEPSTSVRMAEYYIVIRSGVDVSGVVFSPQIESGRTKTAYEPYQGQTLTADLPETLFGFDKNWTTGLLTVNEAAISFDGTEDWIAGSLANTVRMAKPKNAASAVCCTHYKVAPMSSNYDSVNIASYVNFHDSENTVDVETWKAFLAAQAAAGTPVTVVYKLATPYTIQLTPQQLETLKGTNNIWSNAGETEVTYAADTKMYIDQKIAAIAAAIVNE